MALDLIHLAVLDRVIEEKMKAHPSHTLHPSSLECRDADRDLAALREIRAHVDAEVNGGRS
jgi:hypothetical protein